MSDEAGLEELAGLLKDLRETLFARVRIQPTIRRACCPLRMALR